MTLKLAQFCDDPKKYPQNLHTPPKKSIFLKTQKNIEIQNFEPKNGPSLRMCENIRVPPTLGQYTRTKITLKLPPPRGSGTCLFL